MNKLDKTLHEIEFFALCCIGLVKFIRDCCGNYDRLIKIEQ